MVFPVKVHGEHLAVSHSVKAGDQDWFIPEEVPIALVFNRRNYAVMMGTPHDLTDFGLGFALTEEVIKTPNDVLSLDIYISEKGADLRFKIKKHALERLDITQRRRNLVGSASCGLCGLENADTLFKVLPKIAQTPIDLSKEAMAKAMTSLRQLQPLNAQTHSVHAAAWVTQQGDIELSREDVGRHNALDKLLGAMAQKNTNVTEGFVLMSSRCSYEIVEKAARRGVQAILSMSGPTAFATRKATEANMALYARFENQGVKISG
ncbi:formate dehydrogenase accessory sulfurtransferase FdhD [Hellea balneolensis]|uniref:formate dehydrogenase accessory sulfurtransferase FdhD n=1 Tax=Hellea balneolensis TaxID=287478 RepID=UPI00042031E7|nr:formate dehydrogenase accessory sulfurtransferase FdhD [Hellea balneolensis]